MPKLTLNYGIATQHLDVSGSRWRLLSPHPVNNRRLINIPYGVVLPVGSRGQGSELWILGPESAPLIVNGKECAISLGMAHDSVLENKLRWGKAYLFPKKLFDQRNPSNSSPLSSAAHFGQYAVAPIVDASNIFVGFFVRSTITAGIARGTLTFAWVWKADKGGQGYFVILSTGEACWGLGASAGMGVGIFSGMPDKRALENFTQSEASLNVTLAAGNAKNYLNFLRVAEHSSLFGEAGQTIRVMSKAKRVFDGKSNTKWYQLEKSLEAQVKTLWANRGNMTSAAQSIRKLLESNLPIQQIIQNMGRKETTIEVAKMVVTCLGVDGSKPGFHCVGADAGVEVSISAGYTATDFVWPL